MLCFYISTQYLSSGISIIIYTYNIYSVNCKFDSTRMLASDNIIMECLVSCYDLI